MIRQPTAPPGSPDPHWTPRQREVLDLLTSGLTNAEIADRLAISLDGAKWHVAEILGKLQVSSREEAAAYWRDRKRLSARLGRATGLLLGPLSLKAVAVAAGSLTAVVLGIWAGTALYRDLLLDEASQDTTSRPLLGPPIDSVLGKPVFALELAESLPVPEGVAVYYLAAPDGSEGPSADLRRVYRDGSGRLREDRLLFTADLQNAYTYALAPDQGLVGVGVCERGRCGVQPLDAEPTAASGYLSTDGGVSFERLGPLPQRSIVHAVIDTQLVIGTYSADESGAPQFHLFPSGSALEAPAPGAVPTNLTGLGLAWRTEDGSLYGTDGRLLRASLQLGARAGLVESLDEPLSVDTWTVIPDEIGVEGTPYLGLRAADGELLRAFTWHSALMPHVRISPRLVLGNFNDATTGLAGTQPMVIDLQSGTIHALSELAALVSSSDPNLRAHIEAATEGPFVRVRATSSPCVDIRPQPASESIPVECVVAGVLLNQTGPGQDIAGTQWLPVRTPHGIEGWVEVNLTE